MLLSEVVPQADVLNDIVATVEAVAAGYTDFQGIAGYINKGERQGRYYRKAAESMDLIVNYRNEAALTPLGKALVNAQGKNRQEIIKRSVLRNPLVREVLEAV